MVLYLVGYSHFLLVAMAESEFVSEILKEKVPEVISIDKLATFLNAPPSQPIPIDSKLYSIYDISKSNLKDFFVEGNVNCCTKLFIEHLAPILDLRVNNVHPLNLAFS